MRCTGCTKQVGFGAMMIALYTDRVETITLCTTCRRRLLGAEIDDDVTRLVRRSGWVQPVLPNFG